MQTFNSKIQVQCDLDILEGRMWFVAECLILRSHVLGCNFVVRNTTMHLPGLEIIGVTSDVYPTIPIWTPPFSITTDLLTWPLRDGSLDTSRLADNTGKEVTFLTNSPRTSGPSSNSWFPIVYNKKILLLS